MTVTRPLRCRSNADFTAQITWLLDGEEVALSSGRMQVRRATKRGSDLVPITTGSPVFDITATIDGGTATFTVPAATVAALDWDTLAGVVGLYDVRLVSNLGVDVPLEGPLTFVRGVTL